MNEKILIRNGNILLTIGVIMSIGQYINNPIPQSAQEAILYLGNTIFILTGYVLSTIGYALRK